MSYTQTKLTNGLKVVTASQEGTKAVTAMVFAKVGSRHETKRIAGIAHFVEHLAFKGTTKYKTTSILSKKLDSLGADFNAFTDKSYTGYWIKVDGRHLPLALDILSQMTFEPLYQPEEIEREKGVIIGEIHMYEDTPMYLTEEYFDEQLYGTNHPLGRLVIGTKETVQGVTRDDIVAFHDKFYTPKNLTLSIAGNTEALDHEQIATLFGTRTGGSAPMPKRVAKLAPTKKVLLKQKDTEQVHLIMGMPVALRYDHPDYYKAHLANIAFGGSMSSRLFITVRERNGLGYYVGSRINLHEEVADWHVRAGVDKARLDLALKVIKKEWQKIGAGITKAEFKQAKEYYRGKLALAFEDSAEVAEWFARQNTFAKKTADFEETMKKVDAVTHEQVNAWLKKNVKMNTLRLMLVGPFDDPKPFERFLT